jgi:hypothetical protein
MISRVSGLLILAAQQLAVSEPATIVLVCDIDAIYNQRALAQAHKICYFDSHCIEMYFSVDHLSITQEIFNMTLALYQHITYEDAFRGSDWYGILQQLFADYVF